jgi:outer membrane protein
MMKRISVAVVTLVFALSSLSLGLAGDKGLKVGYVNIMEVLSGYSGYKGAKVRLEKAMKTKQAELQGMEQELMELQQEYEKKKSILSEKARKEKQYIMQKKLEDYQNVQQQANRELAAKEQQMTEVLLDELRDYIAQVAKQKGFDLVLDKTAVLYEKSGSADITKLVLEYVEKADAKKKAAK